MEGEFSAASNERELGQWSVRYHSPVGGIYKGKLIVTEQRLLLDQELDDLSSYDDFLMRGVLDSSHHLSIPREAIASIVSEGALRKRVVVRLNDGQEHIFVPGLFTEAKIVDALEKKD